MIGSRAGGGAGASYSGHDSGTGLRALMLMELSKIKFESPTSTAADEAVEPGIGPIRGCVTEALATYFRHLNGHNCEGLYKLVLAEVEQPLLEAVMEYCGGNQTRAAQVLGINRGTLRKKLQQYGLDQ